MDNYRTLGGPASVLSVCAAVSAHGMDRGVTPDDLLGIVDLGISSEHDFEGLAMSPDGTRIAVEVRHASLATNRTEIRWKVVPLGGEAKAVDAGDGGDPVYATTNGLVSGYAPPQRPRWSSDSRWFVYRARHEGETQLWRSSRDGTVQERLTDNASDVGEFVWSYDGKEILFKAGEARHLAQAAVRDEALRGFLYDERFAPFDRLIPLSTDTEQSSIWVYEPDAHLERLASGAERREYEALMQAPRLEGRPHARWVRSSPKNGVRVWLEDLRANAGIGLTPPLTLSGSISMSSKPIVCLHPSCTTPHFKGLWIDDDGRNAYFLRWAGSHDYGAMALYRWRIGSSAVKEVLRTEDLLEGCSRLHDRIICSHESATTPSRLVSVDLSDGRQRTLYDPNASFGQHRFGEVTALRWLSADGTEGFGRLVKPVDYEPGRRYPLIVVQYRSRGFLRGGVGDEYPIHVFASLGFAVLSFHRPDDWELHATSQSYDQVEEKGWIGFRDRKRVLDALDAGLERIESMGFVDATRIGITGLSDGGETLAFALIHAPDRFAAAAASWTWWNPIVFSLVGPRFQQQLHSYGLDNPDKGGEVLERWRGVSIGLNAQRVRTPLRIQVADTEMLPETQTVAALREAGKPVEMYVFPNEYHIKTQPAHRYNAYRRSVQWFQFWLQGRESHDPVDRNQYERWREMRIDRDHMKGR